MWLWKKKKKCHRHVLSVSLCACSVCSCGFHWPFFQSRICLISSALLPPWAHLPVFEGFSKLLSSPVFLRLAQPASYPCLSPVFCPVLFKVMLSCLFLLWFFTLSDVSLFLPAPCVAVTENGTLPTALSACHLVHLSPPSVLQCDKRGEKGASRS